MFVGIREYLSEHGELTVSEGTLKVDDILGGIYEVLVHFKELPELRERIKSCFNKEPFTEGLYYDEVYILPGKMEEAVELLEEVCVDELNGLCPDGYYFGSFEGNSSCIGFFEVWDD